MKDSNFQPIVSKLSFSSLSVTEQRNEAFLGEKKIFHSLGENKKSPAANVASSQTFEDKFFRSKQR